MKIKIKIINLCAKKIITFGVQKNSHKKVS